MKPVTVQVMDYEISTDDEHCERYRLLTTLLDTEYTSVDELASVGDREHL